MVEGFEDEVMDLLEKHSDDAVQAIQEQLYSGLDGNGQYLSPTYLNDPYFDDPESRWYNDALGYLQWKERITPPQSGMTLGIPPRPLEVPNLKITGAFYSQIAAKRDGDVLRVDTDTPLGKDIVGKYGDQILQIGDSGVKYFNVQILTPGIWDYFESCGW